MTRRPKSEAFAALHETASSLHSVGAITDERMREYDEACLEAESIRESYYFLEDVDESAWYWFKVVGGRLQRSEKGYKTLRQCKSARRRAIATANPALAA